MLIATAPRALLVIAVATVAVTAGSAAAKTDKDAAMRRCMVFARAGTPPARPTLAIKRRQTAAYNHCMEQAGFGRSHAQAK